MARLLFILHGMGVHDTDWATPTVAHLLKLPREYKYKWFTQHGPLDKHVTIVPISYDSVFTTRLTQWAQSAAELEKFANTQGVGIGRCLSFLNGASPAEKNFFWTSVVDVLLYRFFPIITAEVRLRVRTDMAKAITAEGRKSASVDAIVLAHSLGTSVAHDALSVLATQPIETVNGPSSAFMLPNFTFRRILQVANVSRVLETSPPVLASPIHPFTVNPQTSYTRGYLNFRHRYDLFPAVKPFKPQGWGAGFFEPAGVNRVLGFNVHDLDLYLDDPRVHVPILRQLIDPAVVDPQEEIAAVATYDAKPEPDCIASLSAFKTRIDALIAEFGNLTDPQDLIIAVTKALAAGQEAKDACT